MRNNNFSQGGNRACLSKESDTATDELIVCDECSEEETVSAEYPKKSAEEDGWYFGVTNKRTLCPECNSTGL